MDSSRRIGSLTSILAYSRQAAATPPANAPARASLFAKVARRVMAICLPLAMTAAFLIYVTPAGAQLHEIQVLRHWIESQPAVAPLIFVAIYCLAAMLALPVWWLQIVAGSCFGLAMGLIWCHVGALISSAASMHLAHWLLGDWLLRRLEPYRRLLGRMGQKLGHNGLAVVTAARVCTMMPFGLSNYLFGATHMGLANVLVGTILGGTLTKMIYVGMGVDPRLLGRPWYLLALVGINLLLLSPLLLRYLRPDWFRRIGIQ